MSDDRSYSIRVPADPAKALSVRVFVAEAARQLGLDDAEVEDLRLLATELLGNAAETGGSSLELSLDAAGGRWRLDARGVGPLEPPPGGLIDRRAVLTGLARLTSSEGSLSLSPLDPD
ncbi:MAG TPA: ATP-binding protein [Actinomycetota bacterium]